MVIPGPAGPEPLPPRRPTAADRCRKNRRRRRCDFVAGRLGTALLILASASAYLCVGVMAALPPEGTGGAEEGGRRLAAVVREGVPLLAPLAAVAAFVPRGVKPALVGIAVVAFCYGAALSTPAEQNLLPLLPASPDDRPPDPGLPFDAEAARAVTVAAVGTGALWAARRLFGRYPVPRAHLNPGRPVPAFVSLSTRRRLLAVPIAAVLLAVAAGTAAAVSVGAGVPVAPAALTERALAAADPFGIGTDATVLAVYLPCGLVLTHALAAVLRWRWR